MVRSSTLVSGFGLLAMSSALPTTAEPSNLQTRVGKDCAAGTSYFKCFTYDGCFASDPCTTPPTTQSTCTNGTTTKDQRDMYVVVPSDPDSVTPAVEYFQVISGDMDINQVGIFTGIPADAKKCSLHWKQGGPDERVFKVTGNGLVSATQVDNLSTCGGVSWSEVQSAKVISKEAGPDFTYWDQREFAAATHGSWDLTCAETIYMKFETLKGAGQDVKEYRNVYLEQDDKNGWYIEYTC
ncbi:hypothetical protein BJ170DRAFT_688002 [Xylariales sp. AK1849]|nr:hypothetical protein BJ170DRAFT_688002 [Xylariales sp. AK1849]